MKLHTFAWATAFALGCAAPAGAAELLGPGVISSGLQETTAAFSPGG